MEEKRKEIQRARNRYDIWIGCIAALVYIVFAWGIDAYWLKEANYILPWLKLLLGAISALTIIAAAAWLGTKINNIVLKTIVWMAAATGLGLTISYLTFQGMETAYQIAYPDISGRISYMATEGIQSRLFVIIVMTNILFILGGSLIPSASEAVIVSSGLIGWIFPVLFCLAFFAGAGYTADSNFNTELRDNVLAINNQIEQVSQLDNTQLTEREERMSRRFTKLEVNLSGPRKILVASFDESFSQAQVLINFNGAWAECSALNGHVGNCVRFEP